MGFGRSPNPPSRRRPRNLTPLLLRLRSLRSLAAEIAAGKPLKPLASPSDEWEAVLAPLPEQDDSPPCFPSAQQTES